MRTSFLGLIAVGLLGSAGCEVQYKPLTPFVSKEGNFQCLFPGEPRWRTRGFVCPVQVAEAINPGVEYAAGYGDFNMGTPTAKDLPTIYKAMKDGVAKEYNGTLVYEMSTQIDGHPGYEFCLKLNGREEGVCKMRCAAIGKRLYMFGVYGEKAEVNSPDARKFLESFRLLGTPAKK